jgi:hypothetical protein
MSRLAPTASLKPAYRSIILGLGLVIFAMVFVFFGNPLKSAGEVIAAGGVATLSIPGNHQAQPGGSVSLPIVLSEAPNGLAGYTLEINVDNPAVAEIANVVFPAFGITSSSAISSSRSRLRAADVNSLVQSGAANITLADVGVKALAEGVTSVSLSVIRLDDDMGEPISPQVISGTITVGSPSSAIQIDRQVAVGADDAHSFTLPGWPSSAYDDIAIWVGNPGDSGPAYGGWRWTGLGIPAGATITRAYVELNQAGFGFDLVTTLALEDAASPQAFSTQSMPHHRWGNRTNFQVSWSWNMGEPRSWRTTPSLAAGIQELVDTYGAVDTVALLESSAGVPRSAYHSWSSFERNPQLAARLHVEYVVR